ncbi:peptidoglycan-binding domain-containing protein [Streptomyces sp. Ju416(a)]|uniref:peptidoglycan-binding protein n=1 Tax=Streptomyces sp. Ju416(a) TaxID=3446591 RepID=UPI00403D96D3
MNVRMRLGATAAALGSLFAFAGTTPSNAVAQEAGTATSTAVPAAGQCPYSGSHPQLEYDDGRKYSAAVKHAQCMFNVNNVKAGGKKWLVEDGYFGWNTRSAIWRIQYACNIDTDYIVGPKTWKCLHLDEKPNPVAEPTGIFPVKP